MSRLSKFVVLFTNTCGAKQAYFWINRFKKSVLYCGLLSAMLGLASCATPAVPGRGRVTDAQGKPIAGAHVISYRMTSTQFFVVQSRSYQCAAEHYSLTGEDGTFEIPSAVLTRPGNAQVSIFNIAAYKPGMFEQMVSTSISRRPVEPGGDEDYFPTKEKPLVVSVVLEEDKRSFTDQYANVSAMTRAGCTCNDFYRVTLVELNRVYEAYRIEAQIGTRTPDGAVRAPMMVDQNLNRCTTKQ